MKDLILALRDDLIKLAAEREDYLAAECEQIISAATGLQALREKLGMEKQAVSLQAHAATQASRALRLLGENADPSEVSRLKATIQSYKDLRASKPKGSRFGAGPKSSWKSGLAQDEQRKVLGKSQAVREQLHPKNFEKKKFDLGEMDNILRYTEQGSANAPYRMPKDYGKTRRGPAPAPAPAKKNTLRNLAIGAGATGVLGGGGYLAYKHRQEKAAHESIFGD